MSAPVTPAQFAACVSDPTTPLCGNFIATLLKLPALIYQFMNWLLDSSGNISTDFLTLLQSRTMPPGSVFASATIQPNAGSDFLLCDGTIYTMAQYPALGALLTNTYGGNGTTTFAVPNLGGNVVMGANNVFPLGHTGGEATHVLARNELPNVSLALLSSGGDGFYGALAANGGTGVAGNYFGIGVSTPAGAYNRVISEAMGSGTAHNNLQPYVALYYYIKT